MEDSVQSGGKQPKGIKRIFMITLVAILVIGGSVAAYVIMDKSPKEKYFLAEKDSLEFLTGQIEKRYQSELDWSEYSAENPIESVMELSAEFNDPSGESYGLMSPEQIINNSTVTMTTAIDREEKRLSSKLEGSLGGFEIGGLDVFVTSEKGMVGLPFVEELLQLKGKDFGKLLSQMDPYTFTGDEELDFSMMFDGNNLLSDEDIDYLKEEYALFIYDSLPDSAFESTDETIKVANETLDTEKIAFNLSEEELKTILSELFEKMANDDRLKDIIQEQYQLQTFGAFTVPQSSVLMEDADQFIADFTAGMEEASEEIEELSMPDGLNSTIWIHNKLIVKRDFEVELGPNEDEMVTLHLNGNHLMEEANQSFTYEIGFKDAYDEGTVELTGELSLENGEMNDSIQLSAEDVVLSYESSESLDDNKKDFERRFSVDDGYGFVGTLNWTGDASYDADQMSSQHAFSVESPEVPQDLLTLHLSKDASTVSSVEIPSDDQVKDLGSMNIDELMMYMEMELYPQFEEWMFGIMGPGF
ncbi:hypothetical protein SAMN05216389_11194 [Oceanobacillus limi]|uniref:DUF945 domain-containing protein n=1 Tax=Oceanobacillus limi TaxID=930131 RepID=A0A1I0EGM4_9BACI|nr:DUF6583 family protein [Oceanobacillus limi]SET43991.1 hypothetical protein SAMN05216389_11194 [Oceanobacillus limi]